MIKTTRLLLPFTHGVEMDTLEAAVFLAESHHATLVSLSLVSAYQANGKGARLEHIQQSKDFLEAAQRKAAMHHVPLERFEVFTGNVEQSIAVLVNELACDGMILALHGRKGSLLGTELIEQLLAMRPCALFLLYLPSKEYSWVLRLRKRLSTLLPGYQQRAEKQEQPSPALGEQAQPLQGVLMSGYKGSPDNE